MKVFCKLCGLRMKRGSYKDYLGHYFRSKSHFYCPSSPDLENSHYSGEWGLTHRKPNFFREKLKIGDYNLVSFTYGRVSTEIMSKVHNTYVRLSYHLKYNSDLTETKIDEIVKHHQILK